MRHVRFLARTVLVQDGNIEEACRILNRILGKEGIFDQFRRTRYYEKPYQVNISVYIFMSFECFESHAFCTPSSLSMA